MKSVRDKYLESYAKCKCNLLQGIPTSTNYVQPQPYGGAMLIRLTCLQPVYDVLYLEISLKSSSFHVS